MFDRRRSRSVRQLATSLGVSTSFRDGLGNTVEVGVETLVRVCAALGAELEHPRDAAAALEASAGRPRSTVAVAWDGRIDLRGSGSDLSRGELRLEGSGDEVVRLDALDEGSGIARVPLGVHDLEVEADGDRRRSTVIAAPAAAWCPPVSDPARWGVAVHLAALRSSRSRPVGDLRDLRSLAATIARAGGSVVTVLPILPTFNDPPAEPSPYSPVSRLFWSELVLDTGSVAGAPLDRIDVSAASAEVERALGDSPVDASMIDAELGRYARFRGAQRRLGRDWRAWPEPARRGELRDEQVDPATERFHLAAELAVRGQLDGLRGDLAATGVTLGLDLAVGVHPEGYDVWSRPHLFADRMAVGAPPDAGFPSGQNWGFSPVLPAASAAEGHRYLRATIAHQAALAGLLRIDHIMALRRLYWIPDGMALDQGTYVDYPMEELFALLCLESHRHSCEVIGENLGTVPPEIEAALERHRIKGMRLAQFSAGGGRPVGDVAADEVAFIGTHDTPTFAGWLSGDDIDLRVELGLLAAGAAPAARVERAEAVRRLTAELGGSVEDPADLLERVVVALGSSPSPLVLLWLEDLWLETAPVNVPGTSSAVHPNWQRPMRRRYDEALADPAVRRLLEAVEAARQTRRQSAAGSEKADGEGTDDQLE